MDGCRREVGLVLSRFSTFCLDTALCVIHLLDFFFKMRAAEGTVISKFCHSTFFPNGSEDK